MPLPLHGHKVEKKPARLPPTISIQSSVTGACAGSTISFTAIVTNGGNAPFYEWKKNGVFAGSNSPVLTTSNLSTGDVITCELTSNASCAVPAKVTSNNIAINFLLSPSGNIVPAIAEICSGQTQVFTATGAASYQWKHNGVSIIGATSATYVANMAGQYSVMLTGSTGCSVLAGNNATLTVLPKPSGSITPATATICNGGTQILSAVGGTSYQWFQNGNLIPGATAANYIAGAAGTYSAMLFNGSCSEAAANTAIINVSATPIGTVSPATANICTGSSVELSATGGSSYQWFVNGASIMGATSDKYNATGAGVYTVLINSASCSGLAANSANITLLPLPSGSITPSAAAICSGQSVSLAASGGTTYQWLLNGAAITGATTDTYDADVAGTYSVIISDANCSAKAINTSTIIKAAQQKGITYPLVRVATNIPFPLQARPGGRAYSWNPTVDLNNPAIVDPVVTTNQNRRYLITILTPLACPVTDTLDVQVFQRPAIYVPTGFTPNGDGKNDLLKPAGVQLKELSFKVMNRWGEVVFMTKKQEEGWNGIYKGRLQPTGTYVWIVEGKDTGGTIIKEKGTTTLIR